jgi:hypothetical protein
MRSGRPPVNHKLGKPVVIRLVYQASEAGTVARLRQCYSRALTKLSFPNWLKSAARHAVEQNARGC